MKTVFSHLAVLATTFSHFTITDAVDGPGCSVVTTDDSYFSVVGVQGTGVHPRRELRELEKDKVSWNLLIQAWARFQAMDQSDKLSYFQIAGIHGAPFGPWDRVEGEGLTGYCPHVSNLFGTWHRPYLALFEQILHERAVEIANEFPVGAIRDDYQDAAAKLRLPYWDWAMNPPDGEEGCMPYSMRRPTMPVTFPNMTNATIPNPLYRYDFHPLNQTDFEIFQGFQFMNWEHTIRFPSDGQSPNATSRDDELNALIGKQQVNNRDMLYKLLTVYQPFNQWSNKANGGKIGNVETLHDGIHNSFGVGHVGIIEVSAFDPAFWLHHSNMDRIVAIYQHRYPETYVDESSQVKPSFFYSKNATLGSASPLKPFHMNANGDFWTSSTARNWESFGYTYPELVNKPSNATLTRAINRLYKPPVQGLTTNITSPDGTSTSMSVPAPTSTSPANQTSNAIDWMAEINMPSDIQTSYAVRVFLGAPNQDPKQWPTDPNCIGQVASLASPRSNISVTVTANVVLTDALAKKYAAGDLRSLQKDDVEAYLKREFHWRMQKSDLTEIPRAAPPQGLNVTVLSAPIHIPASDDEVPVWPGGTKDWVYQPEVQAPAPGNGTESGGGGAGNGSENDDDDAEEGEETGSGGPKLETVVIGTRTVVQVATETLVRTIVVEARETGV